MTKAKWCSDSNCPPESDAQSKKWFDRLTSDMQGQLVSCLQDSKEDEAANRIAETVQKRSEQIKTSSFSKLTELRQAGDNIPPIACKMGCNYCCHLQVHTYPPEVIRIADHLRRTRTAKELSTLVAKMRRHAKFRSGLTQKQKSSGNVSPCPFLGSKGECTIYDVRPVVCRTYHTFNVKECEKVFNNPNKALTVTMVVEPCDTRDALLDALEGACKRLKLHCNEVELIDGVLLALKDPKAATLWRRGQDVFAEATI